MTKLKDFLEVYKPKAPDEQKFVDKHVTIKFKDRNEVGGKENGDDVFNASNVKTVARKDNRQGYNVGEDEKVYEEVDVDLMDENELLEFALDMLEKTLTPAEMKKREEIAKAIERENPKMPMAQKMAIATAQAKKVAEQIDELSDTYSAPVRVPQKMIKPEAARRMANTANRKNMSDKDIETVLFNQGHGRKSLKLINQLRKEEVEEDDGWYTHSQMHGSKKSEKHPKGISAAEWKSGVRWHHGQNKRINIKEETEELEELSKKTLASYISKGARNLTGHAIDIGDGDVDDRRHRSMMRKVDNREKGIATAANKLTKEEVEGLQEISAKAVDSYREKAYAQQPAGDDGSQLYKKRKAGRDMAFKKVTRGAKVMAKEGAEQIDELSNKTLGSYVKKATNQAFNKGFAGGANLSRGQEHEKEGEAQVNKAVKRVIGVNKAVNKMTKEEVEDIEESAKVVDHLIKRYGDNVRKSHVMSAANDFGVGYTGLSRMVRKRLGVNRLEEELDLDEGLMHDRYLRSHGKKARGTGGWAFTTKQYGSPKEKDMHFTSGQKSLSDAHKEAAAKLGTKNLYVMEEAEVPFKGPYSKPGPSKDEYGNTIKNVPRHLARKAMKALTKEDIIDRAVSKYVPEELKFTPEERMIKRLEGLREDHIIMIMSLFESLNDTNQSKMIESAESEDGVNQLLDFAINNRGV